MFVRKTREQTSYKISAAAKKKEREIGKEKRKTHLFFFTVGLKNLGRLALRVSKQSHSTEVGPWKKMGSACVQGSSESE